MADNPYIAVSGQPTFEQQRIVFPSGEFNISLKASLASLQSTFGFNQTPHRFELEYIPELEPGQTVGTSLPLPQIGSGVSFSIEEFFISGRIAHADYSTSTKGKVLSVAVEDIREDLNDFYIDTFGIFGRNDAPSPGIIDIRYWYVNTRILTETVSRGRAVRDLRLLQENGASYRQIYEAIQYFETDIGTVSNVSNKLPDPEVIDAQLPLDPDGYRFKFKAQPLLEAISKVLNDMAYDFYYNMFDNKISVINRKFAVNISEDAIPITNDTAPIINSRFGQDEAERPTNVRLYGGEMEGLIGNGRLMTTTGAYGLDDYDLGFITGTPTYVPGWEAKLKYFGPDGFLNEYVPSDRELKMSLKSLEYWAHHHGLDNRIGNDTINIPDGGISQTQQTVTGSGVGLMFNRRTAGRNWIIEWYNRVRVHAQNNFGRTYLLSTGSALYDAIDDFEVVGAAWCNLENQSETGMFDDNYQIALEFKFLSPFWDADNNKMRGFGALPPDTKWGIDREQTPARFTEWNEDEDDQFVPIEAVKFDSDRQKFKEEFLTAVEENEKGVLIRLPTIASKSIEIEDGQLGKIGILQTVQKNTQVAGTLDIQDPFVLVEPYDVLDKIAIPIKVKRRYGFAFPSIWASGTGTEREVNVDDNLVPWRFEPRGIKQSFDQLDDEALSAIDGRVVNRDVVTFAEANKVGLPIISFDQYADQQQQSNGFGIVSHGITSLSISKTTNWWQTRYNIKSHFPQPIKVRPVREGVDEDFEFSIKRLEQDVINLKGISRRFGGGPSLLLPTDDGRRAFKGDTGREHIMERKVEIVQVFNRGGTGQEYYLGEDTRGIRWPRALDAGFGDNPLKRAFGIDGFFQKGMPAVYHLEKLADGSVLHYFVGGIPLNETKVVVLKEAFRDLGDGIIGASVETLPNFTIVKRDDMGNILSEQKVNVEPFDFLNLPLMNQNNVDAGAKIGDKAQISSHGQTKELKPGADYGPGGDRDDELFIINGAAASTNFPAFVTTKPGNGGRGGAIQSIDASGGQIFTDQTDGFNVFFVGSEPDQIELGDFCTVFRFAETDESGQFRLVCLINKPLFMSSSAFGG